VDVFFLKHGVQAIPPNWLHI